MSEQERIDLFNAIGQGILKAQRKLFERKAKLGEKWYSPMKMATPSAYPAKKPSVA